MDIPKDTILMLSGVSCVGKQQPAYEIVKNYSNSEELSEYEFDKNQSYLNCIRAFS